ncbi:MAG: imidazoleglycerol-phosphate dehydratase HisB [bacterium]|nr:imidazoleglycerol-phosphate dehydratase HisB [bacterium]MCP5042904.1 imidazoleglycerol-phosphate dehydratase HisB [bacterium]
MGGEPRNTPPRVYRGSIVATQSTAGAERRAAIARKTKETDIQVELCLDGSGVYEVSTGVAFFDHMLESFAKHGLFDLTLRAAGDLDVDFHHTVEDVGITLGQALREALGNAQGIRRYGSFVLPMAEAKAEVAVDVSNRPFVVYNVDMENRMVRDFDIALVEDFLQAFAQHAGLDLHVNKSYGESPHHVAEAIFKGTARALRIAVEIDPRQQGLPTVKGAL